MVSAVFVRFCPSATKVRVVLRGGGAPMYFDFARLSFHVPISGLLCANAISGIAVASRAAKKSGAMDVKAIVVRRFMMLSCGLAGALKDVRNTAPEPLNIRVRYQGICHLSIRTASFI